MTWTMEDEHTHFPKECNSNYCTLPYTACIQSQFQITRTAKFEDNSIMISAFGRGQLQFWGWTHNITTLTIENVENANFVNPCNMGTQGIAPGDSGQGHWIQAGDRSVLVGISTGGVITKPGYIQKTTSREILAFIKNNIVY